MLADSATAAPASPPAPMKLGAERVQAGQSDAAGALIMGAGMGGGAPGEPAVVVRSDFRSTLLWQPTIITDETGTARVTLTYGDSLTTWKATARAAGTGQQFGIGNASTRTKMPLIARLQAPRFFLVGDTVTVSGVINNNTDEPQTVTPQLDAEGLTVVAMLKDGEPTKGVGVIEIAAQSEARVDWPVVAGRLWHAGGA